MNDLFKSKKDLLLDFIKGKHYCYTHEVIAWGLQHYCNGADRLARKLAEEGQIRRVSESDKLFRFPETTEDIWESVIQ